MCLVVVLGTSYLVLSPSPVHGPSSVHGPWSMVRPSVKRLEFNRGRLDQGTYFYSRCHFGGGLSGQPSGTI